MDVDLHTCTPGSREVMMAGVKLILSDFSVIGRRFAGFLLSVGFSTGVWMEVMRCSFGGGWCLSFLSGKFWKGCLVFICEFDYTIVFKRCRWNGDLGAVTIFRCISHLLDLLWLLWYTVLYLDLIMNTDSGVMSLV